MVVDIINCSENEFDFYLPYMDVELIALASSKNIFYSAKKKTIMFPKETIN